MSTDYGYINARVRGMKAKLLGPEFYAEALEASDFRAYVSALGQSRYMRDLEEAQSRFQGLRAVDDALARNFFRTTHSLRVAADGRPGELVDLLLLRFDRENLKAIARGKHAGKELQDIQGSLFPAGALKPTVLEAAAAAPDLAAAAQVVAFTATPLRGAFVRAAAGYQQDGDLYQFELAIDRAYYKVLLGRVKELRAPPPYVRHVRREIDATNLRTALKLGGVTAPSGELFIPGGREVTLAMFESLRAEDGQGALQALTGTGFAAVAESGDPAGREQRVRDLIDRSARRLAADPLGPGVVVSFLRLKEAETARLRLLARGKYYGVPRDALERELGHA